jgi:hypothetical protein
MNRGRCIAHTESAVRPEVDEAVMQGVEDVVEEEEDKEEGEEEEDAQRGMRRPQKMIDPKLPSRAEVDEHEKTHLPFRNWCRHCIRGRGKEAPHYTRAQAPSVP